MIGRIRSRTAFERLRREGRRVRIGALWCSFVPDSTVVMAHVAFAIGRPVGSAVVRNRLRRRLRSLLSSADLPPGWYLVGATPRAATLSFQDLSHSVSTMTRKVVERGAGSGD